MRVSYECSDVIEDLKLDIMLYGKDCRAWGVVVDREIRIPFTNKRTTVKIMVNYLIGENEPPTADELEGGQAELSTLGELLEIFEEQNRIV